jgi:hypothetical protein
MKQDYKKMLDNQNNEADEKRKSYVLNQQPKKVLDLEATNWSIIP